MTPILKMEMRSSVNRIVTQSTEISASLSIGKFDLKRVVRLETGVKPRMSAEQNKEMVKATWTAFAKGDIKTAFSNMADKVSWLVPGTTPGVSGVKKGKDEILKFMGSLGNVFPEGLQSEITRATPARMRSSSN